MATLLILTLDLVFQITAACLALRLIRVTGKATAWTLIALGLVVMALSRAFTVYRWVAVGVALHPVTEIFKLVISGLVLGGVALIGPMFRNIKDSEEKLRQSEEKYRTIVETAHEGVGVLDAQDRLTYVNQRMSEIFGYSASEFLGRHVLDFFDDDEKEKMEKNLARRKQGTKEVMEFHLPRKDGTYVWISAAQSPIFSPDGRYLGTIGMINDISERQRAKELVRIRVNQQAAVAGLGQSAIGGKDLPALLDEAAALAARNLNVEYSMILELLPPGDALLLRAGVGWREGLVGAAQVKAGADTQAGYVLAATRPVIVEDLATETRFSACPVLREHGVVSGLSVIIAGPEQPFGVLGAHTARRQTFTQDDLNFLQAMANVLSGAVVRRRSEEALRESEQKLRFLASQLLISQEKERRKISLELHEDLGQTLQALKLQTSYIKQHLPVEQPGLCQECESLIYHLNGIINRVRGLSWELSPHLLEDLGLLATLRYLIDDFCQHYGIKWCQTDFDEIDSLFAPPALINIFRIFQEVLTNIGEHAQASHISLAIKKHSESVNFVLSDDGKSFDVKEAMSHPEGTAGLGLYTVDERVKMLGGSLRINSRPGQGTELKFSVPIPSPDKAIVSPG